MNENDSKDKGIEDEECSAETQSPCVGVCLVNPSRTCTGCGRTLDEIGAWSALSSAEKRTVNQNASARIKALSLDDSGPSRSR